MGWMDSLPVAPVLIECSGVWMGWTGLPDYKINYLSVYLVWDAW